jgi:predicted RecA/RadA family phage recombinase
MATNFVQPGDTLTLQNTAAGVTAGVGVLIGQLFGVALTTAAQNVNFEMATKGVFTLAKTSALAIAKGDVVYWVPGTKSVDKTEGGQKEVGYAVSTAANPSPTVDVLLTINTRASVAA